MISPWQHLRAESVVDAGIFELLRERCRSPRTGAEHDFYVLHGADWCNIVPLTPDDGRVVMIEQYRHGTREVTLEIPGGVVDPGDASPLEAARREMLEETGYEAEVVEATGVIRPNPAILGNMCHSFVARGARRATAPRLEATEDIDVVLVPLADVPGLIATGRITHSLVVVAFAFVLGLRGAGAGG
jgi:8-oxo-dGTP pyrophosphatase MutT (NUDIX family)